VLGQAVGVDGADARGGARDRCCVLRLRWRSYFVSPARFRRLVIARPCIVRRAHPFQFTQMPSSVGANLLDDGVVDTFGSVAAPSGVGTDKREWRTTTAIDFSSGGRGNIRELRNVIEARLISLEVAPVPP
jgi:hypothetical protein